ncbi:hypothetical protein R3398_21460 [Rossellomorea marisflavi]|uniref:hypothetical protein n=1 Tax=Rossellomorea marisflavi TaxID=189381 RepID=UPI00296ED9F6|nr:hypothetical protein [Rossellomorea marisflavi]MDW4528915.1 hypothetical protein [Rossellomorea marisflavi]
MIKNKGSFVLAIIILFICMLLFFPFPENKLNGATTSFMSFPINDQDGFNTVGIIGSILYIAAIVLLVSSLKKYRIRLVFLTMFAYALAPTAAICSINIRWPVASTPFPMTTEASVHLNQMGTDIFMLRAI